MNTTPSTTPAHTRDALMIDLRRFIRFADDAICYQAARNPARRAIAELARNIRPIAKLDVAAPCKSELTAALRYLSDKRNKTRQLPELKLAGELALLHLVNAKRALRKAMKAQS